MLQYISKIQEDIGFQIHVYVQLTFNIVAYYSVKGFYEAFNTAASGSITLTLHEQNRIYESSI